jgi:hypothetical protein
MQRTIIIGDLHGCYNEAMVLFERLAVSQSDRVIFAGDLVDRGPKPRECVELAMQFESVLGNHEERHLQQRHRPDDRLSEDHLRTRRALGDEHFAYFASLPLWLRLPEYNAAVVHAGCFPGVPLESQSPHHLLHLQHINPPSPKSFWPSKAPVTHRFWANFWQGPERIIFGHSVLSAPLVSPWAVGVDTGAVFGHGLTALVLPDWELVTVPSKDASGGKKTIALYDVMNGVKAFS